MKLETQYQLSKYGVAGFIILVIIASVGFYFLGATEGQQTTTVGRVTITSIHDVTMTVVSVSADVQYATVTSVVFSTLTYEGPQWITISGTAKSNGIGTSATSLVFVNTQDNLTSAASVSGGSYSYSLLNHAFYLVKIKFTTAIGGLGSGECTAGGLALFLTFNSTTANWSC